MEPTGSRFTLRWEEEIPCLGKLPPADYDTSLKVFRKVYKDCQLSYNGNRYKVPYHVSRQKSHAQGQGPAHPDLPRSGSAGQLPGTARQRSVSSAIPGIYEQLKRDQEQLGRKYGQEQRQSHTGTDHTGVYTRRWPIRPLAEYEHICAGGVSWNN